MGEWDQAFGKRFYGSSPGFAGVVAFALVPAPERIALAPVADRRDLDRVAAPPAGEMVSPSHKPRGAGDHARLSGQGHLGKQSLRRSDAGAEPASGGRVAQGQIPVLALQPDPSRGAA